MECWAEKREKRSKGSFEKDAASGREIYLCSVHLNHVKGKKQKERLLFLIKGSHPPAPYSSLPSRPAGHNISGRLQHLISRHNLYAYFCSIYREGSSSGAVTLASPETIIKTLRG